MNHDTMEQAADWLDRQNELTPAEQDQFACWLKHAENLSAYQKISRAMGAPELHIALNNKIKLIDAHAGAAKRQSKAKKTAHFRASDPQHKNAPALFFAPHWKYLAAGIACIASMLMWYWSELQQPASSPAIAHTKTYPESRADYMATVFNRKSTLLADGTLVYLNASSELHVEQQSHARHAVLSQGQAYFSVAHDKLRPFNINAGLAQIEVVGTQFDVDRLSDRLIVSVYEGHVRVRTAKVYDLFKGQQITLIDGQPPQLSDVNLAMLPDWRSGWLDISQQPLATVLEKLQRYLSKTIELDPSIASDLSINGRFALDEPQKSLRLLAKANHLVIEEQDDKIQLRAL